VILKLPKGKRKKKKKKKNSLKHLTRQNEKSVENDMITLGSHVKKMCPGSNIGDYIFNFEFIKYENEPRSKHIMMFKNSQRALTMCKLPKRKFIDTSINIFAKFGERKSKTAFRIYRKNECETQEIGA